MPRETRRKKNSPIVHCGKQASALLVARWSIKFNYNFYHYLNVKPQELWGHWSKCCTSCSLQHGQRWKHCLNPEVTTAKPPSQTCCRFFLRNGIKMYSKKSPNNDQLMTFFFDTISKLERKFSQGISNSESKHMTSNTSMMTPLVTSFNLSSLRTFSLINRLIDIESCCYACIFSYVFVPKLARCFFVLFLQPLVVERFSH